LISCAAICPRSELKGLPIRLSVDAYGIKAAIDSPFLTRRDIRTLLARLSKCAAASGARLRGTSRYHFDYKTGCDFGRRHADIVRAKTGVKRFPAPRLGFDIVA
jgi:hypothetical protein